MSRVGVPFNMVGGRTRNQGYFTLHPHSRLLRLTLDISFDRVPGCQSGPCISAHVFAMLALFLIRLWINAQKHYTSVLFLHDTSCSWATHYALSYEPSKTFTLQCESMSQWHYETLRTDAPATLQPRCPRHSSAVEYTKGAACHGPNQPSPLRQHKYIHNLHIRPSVTATQTLTQTFRIGPNSFESRSLEHF
jgi:hypothetical protein